MKEVVEKLIDQFKVAPPAAVRGFRDCLTRNPDAFRQVVFEVIAEGRDQAVTNYLTALLAHHHLLIPWLVRPEYFTAEQAIEISRKLVKYDPTTAATFTHLLSDMALRMDRDEVSALRILAIHGAVSSHPSTPLLTRFLNSASARVRSKAALLIGRVNRSVQWVKNQLEQSDPRLRANALESLWGVTTPEACELFRTAASDPVRRVAGNAVIALYKAGEVESLSLLAQFLTRAESDWQATAAWAAGESGDVRFLDDLEKSAATGDATAKRNAKRAQERIRQRSLDLEQAGRLDVVAVNAVGAGMERRARVSVVKNLSGVERHVRGLRATDFVIRSNGKPVLSYSVTEHPSATSLALGVVWPWEAERSAVAKAAWTKAAETLTDLKRQCDCWSVLQYVESSDVDVVVATHHGPTANAIVKLDLSSEVVVQKVNRDGLVTRSTDPSVIAGVLRPTDVRPACATGLDHALNQMLRAVSMAREAGHLIVVAANDPAPPDLPAAIDRARHSRIHVHVCVQSDKLPEPYFALANATGGVAVAEPNVCDGLTRLLRNLTGYYEIAWQAPQGVSSVEIHSDRGCSGPMRVDSFGTCAIY